ncbi:MAG: glycosyltransferase family 2 protein [Candidatus Sericytochromatia bacterium]|nr:glycosyltransferase family 2 protein [Candidatus Sericytochromatia bacterium]
MSSPSLPHVGVVVLNWRGAALTRRCLASLRAGPGYRLQVLVVDNGSGEAEVAALSEWAEVLALPENLGFAGGMNRGAAALLARGVSHLLLLNNDAELDGETLAHLLAAEVAIAAPTIWQGHFPERSRSWYAGGRLRLGEPLHGRPGAHRAGPVGFASACVLLVEGSTWQALGGLDERYFLYHEDVDFCLRARAIGLWPHWVPQAEAWHLGGASTGRAAGVPALVDYYDTRNGLRVIRTRLRGPARLAALLWWAGVRLPRKLLRILALGPERRAALRAVQQGLGDAWRGHSGARGAAAA